MVISEKRFRFSERIVLGIAICTPAHLDNDFLSSLSLLDLGAGFLQPRMPCKRLPGADSGWATPHALGRHFVSTIVLYYQRVFQF